MSLVKWIRKNNRKIMVFVVIFCMIAFVVGYTGLQIISSVFDSSKKVVATYGDGEKLRVAELRKAVLNELVVLREFQCDQYLASQGINGVLLVRLLFPDSPISSEIPAMMKQAVQGGQLQISLGELEDYFSRQTERPEYLWVLLRAEAYRSGNIISAEQAKEVLRTFVPNNIILTEEKVNQVAHAFADLLSILQYATNIMNNQAVTLSQVKAFVGRNKERLDVEFIQIPADPFVSEDMAVSDADMNRQFEAFKAYLPNDPIEGNPFGFGYRLPKRVRIEYMIVQTDDVKAQIKQPTDDALESYYSRNIQQFQKQVPLDPNNPESETTSVRRSFPEVEPDIRRMIENEKINDLANLIFNEIKNITELGFESITFDEATVDQLQMAAGDFETAAKEILKQYKVPLMTGKTDWLSTGDFQQDQTLRSLNLLVQQRNRIPLSELVFAASPEAKQVSRRIGLPTIRLWQNIGPVKGGYYDADNDKYYPMMALVRVIGIEDEAVPENIDVRYNTRGVALFEEPDAENVFSVRENVKKDLLLQQAMDIVKKRAEEFQGMVKDKGWDEAIKSYNAAYAKTAEDQEESDPLIQLDSAKQQMRASQTEIAFVKKYIQDNPARAAFMQQRLNTNMLNNQLYELLEDGSQSTGVIREIIAFEPEGAYYVIKEVVRQPATTADYLESKASVAIQAGMEDSAVSALIHFAPDNILKRMNYQPKIDQEEQSPDETENEDKTE